MTVSISKVTQGLLRVTQAGVAAPLKYGQYLLLGHVTLELALREEYDEFEGFTHESML